jgi:hypothetical protein
MDASAERYHLIAFHRDSSLCQEDYGPDKQSHDSAVHCDTEADVGKPDRFSQ